MSASVRRSARLWWAVWRRSAGERRLSLVIVRSSGARGEPEPLRRLELERSQRASARGSDRDLAVAATGVERTGCASKAAAREIVSVRSSAGYKSRPEKHADEGQGV